MNFDNLEADFFELFNSQAIQRLGYLLDLLGYEKLADTLEQKAKQTGIKFKKCPLSLTSKKLELSEYKTDNKWKIIINEEIETDNL
ncbi:hypothetical protein FACS1894155_12820 [Bacteroidia bacterium]|nr:hypothetical protein FACS1894155_12820 [Bacteroidia bacterium]